MGEPFIRRYRATDLAVVYEIACRTGDAGGDAGPLLADRRLIGEIWAAPYVTLEPEHAYVLDDGGGEAIGYVLAAFDAVGFAARCEREWWPALRRRYPRPTGGHAAAEGGDQRLDERLIRRIHQPPPPLASLCVDYPSELHVDILASGQGGGWGRRLIATVTESLRAAGSPGVHLGTSTRNERAVAFYGRLGFSELAPPEAEPPSRWFGLRF